MAKTRTWKLTFDDNSVQEFHDIRRIVGNQIIRAYLLEEMLSRDLFVKKSVRMRGPKDEFKDFAQYLILEFKNGKNDLRILAESGVYENLRIVGTDLNDFEKLTSHEFIDLFTNVLKEPDKFKARLTISEDSKITA